MPHLMEQGIYELKQRTAILAVSIRSTRKGTVGGPKIVSRLCTGETLCRGISPLVFETQHLALYCEYKQWWENATSC